MEMGFLFMYFLNLIVGNAAGDRDGSSTYALLQTRIEGVTVTPDLSTVYFTSGKTPILSHVLKKINVSDLSLTTLAGNVDLTKRGSFVYFWNCCRWLFTKL